MIHASAYTICNLLFAQRMDIYRFTHIDGYCQFGKRVVDGYQTLCFTQSSPCRARLRLFAGRHEVCQLHDAERQLFVVPQCAPVAHHLFQQFSIYGRAIVFHPSIVGTGIRFTLIPHHTINSIRCQGVEHSIVKHRRQVLYGCTATWTGCHQCSFLHFPLFAETQGVAIFKDEHIGFFVDEMGYSVFADEAYGQYVVTFVEQTGRNLVAAWRILIIGASHLATIYKGVIHVEEGSHQQSRCFSGMLAVDVEVLAKPQRPPIVAMVALCQRAVLVHGAPVFIVISLAVPSFSHAFVALVKQFRPSVVCHIVGFILCCNHLRIIVQHGFLYHYGKFRQ